ncbi:MAG TPA: hypothetical protein VHL09_11150 [Dehalococcoidia bacterium]|nr:hypothetical protein [Dehalococcoidia bacterium]
MNKVKAGIAGMLVAVALVIPGLGGTAPALAYYDAPAEEPVDGGACMPQITRLPSGQWVIICR